MNILIRIHSFILFFIMFGLVVNSNSVDNEKSKFLSYNFKNFRVLNSNSTSSEGFGIRCFWLETKTMAVFDLKLLKRPILQKEDYNFATKDNKLVHYNFCENILKQCSNSPSQASIFDDNSNNSTCNILAGPIKNENNWELLNSTNASVGLKITLGHGSKCKYNENLNFTTEYILKCNPYMADGKFNLTNSDKFDGESCKNILEFESKEACPKVNFYVVWEVLQKYNILFGAVLIIIGLFELLIGAKLLVATIFITTCFSVITVVFIFLFQFIFPNGAHPAIVWVGLAISVICGLILGYFVTKYNKIVLAMILGGYMGYVLGLLLQNLLLSHINASPNLIFWVTVLICIAACIIIAYFLVQHIIILATSFCGAYAFVRGISLYAGGFPNESYVMDLINNNENALKEILTPLVYAYLAGWALLFVLGVIFQYKTQNRETHKNEWNENSQYYLKK